MNRGCPLEQIVTRGVELGTYPGATLVVMQGQRVEPRALLARVLGVLQQVVYDLAQLLRSGTRATDFVGRWGGEEFLIITSAASEADVLDVMVYTQTTTVETSKEKT